MKERGTQRAGPFVWQKKHWQSLALTGAGLTLLVATPAWSAAPSSGTILQQSAPPPASPSPPGSVLSLPSPKEQAAESATPIPVKRIRITGNHLVPTSALAPLVKSVEGRTVTLGELQRAARRISDAYHARGYLLAYAYVPAQSVRGGVVTVRVVEPHYDRIDVSGHSRLSHTQARRTLGVAAGEPIAAAPLHRGLLLLERTPGVHVGATFVPGAQPGTSTLKLHLGRTGVLSASVREDNYGSDYTGRWRTQANLGLANPFGWGSQLAVNGMTTSGGLLHSGGAAFVSPNLWNGLRAGAYASRTIYRLGGAFAALDQRGHANQVGADLSYPVILQPGRLVSARLDVLRDGFEERSPSVGLDKRSHLTLARLTLSAALAESGGGVTTAGVSLARGTLTLDSADARAADAAGPNAAGAFWVGHLRLAQRQRLPLGLRLRASFAAQIASANLDGSQQFYLGGPYAVMSYPVSDAGGDEGLLVRTRLAHALPLPDWAGRLDLALLAQGGTVWVNHHVYASFRGSNRVSLGGAGLGLDYRWGTHLHARLAYVRALGPTQATTGPDHGGELWASLRLGL